MNDISRGGALPRPSRAQLAALIVAGGLLSTIPVQANTDSGHGLWLKDRTNLIAHKAKDSICGKCGANSCGESYMDRVRQKQKNTARHTSQRLRSHSKNQAGRASKPSDR